jgi:peptidoglycan/xylan/chitin deacetylase (PgdA/CDA1 family)
VYLTFDDGPHPQHTPRILDALRASGVKATFFVLGSVVDQHPDLVRRILDEGHIVGNHTYSHAPRSVRSLLLEVGRTSEALMRAAGASTDLFRPPRGTLSAVGLALLWFAGLRVVLWNVDPRDFAACSADELLNTFAVRPLRGGDIVLLHDDSAATAEALPRIIECTRAAGLDFKTVSGIDV